MVEKWKKYLIVSIGFYLLDFYLSATVGWSSFQESGGLFYVGMQVIPTFTLMMAYAKWTERKGKKNLVLSFNWKRVTLYFLMFAIASYLFAIYIYLYPGTVFTIAEGLFWGIGALIFGTVCLFMAFCTAWQRVRLTEEFDFQ